MNGMFGPVACMVEYYVVGTHWFTDDLLACEYFDRNVYVRNVYVQAYGPLYLDVYEFQFANGVY